ncbi:MAG: cytochrome c [Cyanobacteriota/Melainabacteria group bacterium]
MSTLRNLTPSILLISLLLPLQLFDAAVAKESKKGAKKPDQAAARALKKKIEEGKTLYRLNGCADCHSINNKGCKSGVPLDGLSKTRSLEFIKEHLKDPEEHVKKNAAAYENSPNMMPDMNLSSEEIGSISQYLHSLPVLKKDEQKQEKQQEKLPDNQEDK